MRTEKIEDSVIQVGKRIKMLREELGINQRTFAPKLGLAPSNLSAIEWGKVRPSVNLILLMNREYRVSFDWILANRGPMFLKKPPGGKISDIDIGDQTDRLQMMLRHMEESPIFRNMMMNHFVETYIKNQDIIDKDKEFQKRMTLEKAAKKVGG
jgi:DNA-binding XRE family transcriptional regulator